MSKYSCLVQSVRGYVVAACTKVVKVASFVVIIQWNLRIKDTLGAELLSFFGGCPLVGGSFKLLFIAISKTYRMYDLYRSYFKKLAEIKYIKHSFMVCSMPLQAV